MNNNLTETLLNITAAHKVGQYVMKEKNERLSGKKIAPDTIGVDYFFLISFLTPKMGDDFPVIERDFLNKCRTKLDEFNAVGWYGVADVTYNNPIQTLHANILRLIYNGAKSKDEYCLELIKSLYKIYHKKEYGQLKRFKRLSGDDLVSLSEGSGNPISDKMATARILAMAGFMDIDIDDRCSLFYYLLEDEREMYMSAMDKHTDTNTVSEKKYYEYGDMLEKWISESKKTSASKAIDKSYVETERFIAECFKQHGFSDDYMQICTDFDGSRAEELIYTLAVLKMINPRKEYTLDDVYVYSGFERLITAFTDIISDYDYEVGFLLGDQLDEAEMEDVLFNPANITYKEKLVGKQPTRYVNIAPVSNDSASKEDFLTEIDRLRGQLKEKEQYIKHIRDKYRASKQTADAAESKIVELEADREELIALREFVFNLEDKEVPQEDELLKMKGVIAGKRIVIIGGHQNWHSKLKKMFPSWLLIHMDEFKTVTTSMLENKDYVFFYSDYIDHKSYNKCVAMVRENGIPFGYLHGVNPDIIITQVYDVIQ